jgi:hypothetical protein
MGSRAHGVHLVTILAVALTGCAANRPTPVRGVVRFGGEPVARATVLFVPDGPKGGRPASGFTSSDGTFRLTTYRPDDGALPGPYRVVVEKTEAAKDRETAEQSALERAKAKFEEESSQRARKPALPTAYADFDTTPLRCTVPVSGEVTLDLHKDAKH